MSQEPPLDYQPPNPQVELAKMRNRAAAERTLMAWIRTSLSLISFGFGIDRIVAAIHDNFGGKIHTLRLSRWLGLSFIALGVYSMFKASLEHRQELKRIQKNPYVYVSRQSLGLVIATALIVIGVVAFISILLLSQS